MTLKEIEATLLNGFHDARVHRWQWDLEQRTAILEMSLWIGDLHEQDDVHRERRDRCRLVLQGVQFLQIEAPAPGYPYGKPGPITVDLYDPEREHPLAREQPPRAFGARFFVQEWNAFIHLAAEDADLVPLPRGGS